jgi:hypothetical protein
MGRRQGHEPRALRVEERVRTNEQVFGPPARESRESRVDFPAGAGFENLDGKAERAAGDRSVPLRRLGDRHIGRINQDSNALAPGNSSCSSANRFATRPVRRKQKPVTFPAG